MDIAKEPTDIAKDPMGGFGSLKAVLGVTSAVSPKVCLELLVYSPLTDQSVGNCHHQKQDQ